MGKMKIVLKNSLSKNPSMEKCDENILFVLTECSRKIIFSNYKA